MTMIVRLKRYLCCLMVLGVILASLNTGFASYAASSDYIYVLTKVQYADGGICIKFSYDKDGFMIKEENTDKGGKAKDSQIVTNYVYSQGKVISSEEVSSVLGGTSTTTNRTYSYDSKDRLKKVVYEGPDDFVSTTKYEYDKKNRKTKEVTTIKGESRKCTKTYKYNSKNQLIKYSSDNYGEKNGGIPIIQEYKYDGKGNVNKIIDKVKVDGKYHTSTTKKANAYKNGRIIRTTTKYYMEDNTLSGTIKKSLIYKKIKVSKKYKKLIETQQKELITDHS